MQPIRNGQGAARWPLLACLVWASVLGACEPATHTVGVATPGESSPAPTGLDETAGASPSADDEPSARPASNAAPSTSAWGEAMGPIEEVDDGASATGQGDQSNPQRSTPVNDTGEAGAGGSDVTVGPEPTSEPDNQNVLIPTITLPIPTAVDTPVCLQERARHRRVDLYLLVDRVFSLPISSPIDAIEQGLSQFVSSPEAAGTGAAMLAVQSFCNAALYRRPDVNWGLLPGHADAIETGVRNFNISVAQAEAAIEAAIGHARKRAKDYPRYRQVLVLITDGFDLGYCPESTPESTEETVATGPNGSPSIPMYVVALGTSTTLDPRDLIPDSLSLAALAEAGGTEEARVVNVVNGGDAVAAALDDVRLAAQPCEYEVPADMDAPELWLEGDDAPLPTVADAGDCGGDEGFYVGEGDANGFLVACPASCERIKGIGHDRVLVGPPCE